MSTSGKLEKLNELLKHTKRMYKRVILEVKVKIFKANSTVKSNIRKPLNVKYENAKLIENSVKESIKNISSSKFNVDESLIKIYSLIDKQSFILKSKPSKILSVKSYIYKGLHVFLTGIFSMSLRIRRKLAFPPILYSKSFIVSMREVRSWHTNLYIRLTSGFKDFNKTFLKSKPKLNNYLSMISSSKTKLDIVTSSSKTRLENVISSSTTRMNSAISSSISKSKGAIKRFLD
ncbi:MAG: hypothetical protein N3E39_01285 [Candidatus Methanomethylicia archaeon]|nr:hypothetical protein [Candidatus Methanomethylicia archaeon]